MRPLSRRERRREDVIYCPQSTILLKALNFSDLNFPRDIGTYSVNYDNDLARRQIITTIPSRTDNLNTGMNFIDSLQLERP